MPHPAPTQVAPGIHPLGDHAIKADVLLPGHGELFTEGIPDRP